MHTITHVLKIIVSSLVLTFIVGCSTTGSQQEEQEAKVNQYIADNNLQSVERITTFRFYSWSQLTDYHLIISTAISKPYLIELKARCHDLRFAQSIKVNQSGSSLHANFDSVKAVGSSFPDCFIKSIYPLSKDQAEELRSM